MIPQPQNTKSFTDIPSITYYAFLYIICSFLYVSTTNQPPPYTTVSFPCFSSKLPVLAAAPDKSLLFLK